MNKTQNLCCLSNYGYLKVSGPDTLKFLQGQISCDVEKLVKENTWSLGVCCLQNGRVVATFFTLILDTENVALIMPKDNIENAKNHLAKYSMFSKVELVSNDDNYSVVVVKNNFSNEKQIIRDENESSFLSIGEYQLGLIDHSVGRECATFDKSQWEEILIEQNIAMINAAGSEQYLPHDFAYHLNGGLDFDKGCYLGQEIIARMHFRGTLKKGLHYIEGKCEEAIKSNDRVFDNNEKSLGNILNVVWDNGKFKALAILPLQNENFETLYTENKTLISLETNKIIT